jgi:hypothetical protein
VPKLFLGDQDRAIGAGLVDRCSTTSASLVFRVRNPSGPLSRFSQSVGSHIPSHPVSTLIFVKNPRSSSDGGSKATPKNRLSSQPTGATMVAVYSPSSSSAEGCDSKRRVVPDGSASLAGPASPVPASAPPEAGPVVWTCGRLPGRHVCEPPPKSGGATRRTHQDDNSDETTRPTHSCTLEIGHHVRTRFGQTNPRVAYRGPYLDAEGANMAHDLVITGGTVVDGTGAVPVRADVAVDGDRITAVGAVDAAGAGPGDRRRGPPRHARASSTSTAIWTPRSPGTHR